MRAQRRTAFFALFLLAGMTVDAGAVGKGYASHEENLRARLFSDNAAAGVQKSSLPKNASGDGSAPINVALGVYFYSLGQLDELAGTVSMSMWQRMAWKDPNLVWNISEYGRGGVGGSVGRPWEVSVALGESDITCPPHSHSLTRWFR